LDFIRNKNQPKLKLNTMMLLVAGSLALLVVFAGVKLHIQTTKETLGHIYKCASWFFIIAGFLILACAGACCIAMCCRYGSSMMGKGHRMMEMHHHMMEEHHCDGYSHMGFMEHEKMMKHKHGMCGEECNIFINCPDEDSENCYKVCKTDSAYKTENKTNKNR
jgi:hypothetical protein